MRSVESCLLQRSLKHIHAHKYTPATCKHNEVRGKEEEKEERIYNEMEPV